MAATVAALTLGCGGEADRFVRPGGGGGGTQEGPDAGEAPPTDAGPGLPVLAGELCLLTRLDAPPACGDPAVGGVTVAAEEAVAAVQADAAGAFRLELMLPGTVWVAAGTAEPDGLVTTWSQHASGEGREVPVVDELAWTEQLDRLLEFQVAGAILIYVVDAAGDPVPGATVAAPSAGRLYYDDGAGGLTADGAATGADGYAVLLDTGSVTVTATEGTRTAARLVQTGPLAIGVTTLVLPDP